MQDKRAGRCVENRALCVPFEFDQPKDSRPVAANKRADRTVRFTLGGGIARMDWKGMHLRVLSDLRTVLRAITLPR